MAPSVYGGEVGLAGSVCCQCVAPSFNPVSLPNNKTSPQLFQF